MGSHERCAEIAAKSARLIRMAEAANLRGVLISTQPNFSWITSGLTNRIDASRESGNGALLFTTDGRRFVVANTIECPRLAAEALNG